MEIESTTLWDFPRQNYSDKPHGNNKYNGVTPAQVIWNLLQRYTKEGDLVVDPMNFIIPSILSDFIQHLGQTMGINSDSIQVRVVVVDDLNNLPKPVLEQLLEKAVEDENFELASKVRDAIKTTDNNETN